MREKIWYEMVHNKFGEIYLSYYIGRKKVFLKWYMILILIFSTSGVFGWYFWNKYSVIACIIISAIQILRLIETHIIPNDKEIEKIISLSDKYTSYHNDLEKLWVDFDSYSITEIEAKDHFYLIRKKGEEIQNLDNNLNIKQIKRIHKKTEKVTKEYLNQYHS